MPDDVHTLEQEAAHHRAQLVGAVSQLFTAANPERLAGDLIRDASDLGSVATQHAVQTARRNPAGVAVVGIGLAMLALSARAKPAPEPTPDLAGPDLAGQDARIAQADARLKQRAAIEAGRYQSRQTSSETMRKLLDKGLDALGPQARDRVTTARLRALDAQVAVEREAAKASAAAKQRHQDQPFTTGLLAAGIGALVGGLLPSTKAEGELLGATRDRLLRDAEAMLHAEIAALEAKGQDAAKRGIDEASATLAS